MDYVLLILSTLLIIIGLLGCFLPVLPGPPLSFVALLLLQATKFGNFSTNLLFLFGGLTVVVTILDHVIPIWGTKKFGGSKSGIWGATIGLICGFFLSPIGIILGPFIGAVIGELIAGKDTSSALKSGFGAFIGFFVGTILKISLTGVMIYYFFKEVITNW